MKRSRSRRTSAGVACALLMLTPVVLGLWGCRQPPLEPSFTAGLATSVEPDSNNGFVVLGYNDLGMHCMNQDFSEFMILPPFNTLHAQVISKLEVPPRIVTDGVTVSYSVPGNTISSTKTNFWTYVQPLLGVSLPLEVGLTGHGLSGTMSPTGNGDWSVTGIPLTPMNDAAQLNAFQLADVTVTAAGVTLATARPVVPVSWELRCDLCHHGAPDAPKSVLQAHDLLHGTSLYDPDTGGPAGGKPVLCGGCHKQIELGLPGQENCENLSLAMHKAHAPRMMDVVSVVPKGITCYACHPGLQTQCLRDVHARMQMTCYNCHAGGAKDPETAMLAVGDPAREPWVTEPRCDDCHHRKGYEYEQAGTLFRNSKGHGGVFCEGCHNSTHAITPANDAADNVQSIALQHHAGSIDKCTVCHAVRPPGAMAHRFTGSAPPE